MLWFWLTHLYQANLNNDLASGTLKLVEHQLNQGRKLEELSELLGTQIGYVDKNNLANGTLKQIKKSGFAVNTNFLGETQAFVEHQGKVAQLDFHDSVYQPALGTAQLFHESNEDLPNLINQFSYPVQYVEPESLELSHFLWHQLTTRGFATDVNFDHYELTLWYQPEPESALLQLGPGKFYSPLPITYQVIMIGFLFATIALMVFALLKSFENRLARLERVTRRLSLGHLKSRVQIEGNDSLSHLGIGFNKMADHIQRLIDTQREMVRAVSHELRTPVARIRFGLQMLEDFVSNDAAHSNIKAMDSDIAELDELVDEILTYARLEEGGPLLEFHNINIVELLTQLVEESRVGRDLNIQLQFPKGLNTEDYFFEAEARYLHRAVQNLVNNACRYAKQDVLVNCEISPSLCKIIVEDDGQGIPEKDWNRVFAPFARLDDSRTRSSGGYGLGLSIVRRIIFWHSGDAEVGRSRFGGAMFSLTIPKRQ